MNKWCGCECRHCGCDFADDDWFADLCASCRPEPPLQTVGQAPQIVATPEGDRGPSQNHGKPEFDYSAGEPQAVELPALPDVGAAMQRAFNLGQTYWQQADSESYSQNRNSVKTRAKFHEICAEIVEAVRATVSAALAAQAEPSGDRLAYEGAREDLLMWKRRAQVAERRLSFVVDDLWFCGAPAEIREASTSALESSELIAFVDEQVGFGSCHSALAAQADKPAVQEVPEYLVRARYSDGVEVYLPVRGSHDIGNGKVGIDVDMPDDMESPAAKQIADKPAEEQAEPDAPDLLHCEIQPRPLGYSLRDYHHAPSGGALNFTWQDKPHRLLYDLIAAVRYYAALATTATAAPVAMAWRDHVEQRIRGWRQTQMNRSGDMLAIDDFMGADDIDALVDFVCDEFAGPPAAPHPVQTAPQPGGAK